MEKTFYIGNVKVIAVDNCTNPEERRKRLEKAIINFYKQAEREKQNDKRRIEKHWYIKRFNKRYEVIRSINLLIANWWT